MGKAIAYFSQHSANLEGCMHCISQVCAIVLFEPLLAATKLFDANAFVCAGTNYLLFNRCNSSRVRSCWWHAD